MRTYTYTTRTSTTLLCCTYNFVNHLERSSRVLKSIVLYTRVNYSSARRTFSPTKSPFISSALPNMFTRLLLCVFFYSLCPTRSYRTIDYHPTSSYELNKNAFESILFKTPLSKEKSIRRYRCCYVCAPSSLHIKECRDTPLSPRT